MENITQQHWLKAKGTQYTIYYVSDYEQDVEFVRIWLEQTEYLMLDKYGVRRHGYDMLVYLHPAPTENANLGLARLFCCSQNQAQLHYLTPSAPAYGEGPLGTLGLPANDYRAKSLVHGYIMVGHQRISANKPRGFGYYDTPKWFYEGLQEYDGMFHSTEVNRTIGYKRLLDHADKKLRDTFYSFGSTDKYFGGPLLMKFMSDQFGAGIHVDLLKNKQLTFEEALAEELKSHGRTVSEAFDDFQRWFELKRPSENINR